MLSAIRRKIGAEGYTVPEAKAAQRLLGFLRGGITAYAPVDMEMTSLMDVASQLERDQMVYDCVYRTLAMERHFPPVTADNRFREAMDKLVWGPDQNPVPILSLPAAVARLTTAS